MPPSGTLCIRWVDLARQSASLLAYGGANGVSSPDELRRASRLTGQRRREAFLASRIALRLILGECADIRWFGREFAERRNGKPYLPNNPVHFSLSRSHDLATVALFERPVGIDVEHNRVLSAPTRAALRRTIVSANVAGSVALPTSRPSGVFEELRAWTQLEAITKLHDGRLAEHFAGWTNNRRQDATADTGEQRRFDPIADNRDLVCLTVPVPAGYACTCCVVGPVGSIDAAAFTSPSSSTGPRQARQDA